VSRRRLLGRERKDRRNLLCTQQFEENRSRQGNISGDHPVVELMCPTEFDDFCADFYQLFFYSPLPRFVLKLGQGCCCRLSIFVWTPACLNAL
jgi:hypothetical protein